MTSSVDPLIIVETLRRQGVSLPPERQDQVTATATRLASTSRLLEDERLSFATDIYGFQTALHHWVARR